MDANPAETYHLLIEAIKFAYSLRPKLGDGDFEPEVKKVRIYLFFSNNNSLVMMPRISFSFLLGP